MWAALPSAKCRLWRDLYLFIFPHILTRLRCCTCACAEVCVFVYVFVCVVCLFPSVCCVVCMPPSLKYFAIEQTNFTCYILTQGIHNSTTRHMAKHTCTIWNIFSVSYSTGFCAYIWIYMDIYCWWISACTINICIWCDDVYIRRSIEANKFDFAIWQANDKAPLWWKPPYTPQRPFTRIKPVGDVFLGC